MPRGVYVHKRGIRSEESLRRMSEAAKARWRDPEFRAKVAASWTPERRAENRERMRQVVTRPEVRANIVAACKRRIGSNASRETRAKMSETQKRRHQEHGAYQRTPETIAKLKASQQRRWAATAEARAEHQRLCLETEQRRREEAVRQRAERKAIESLRNRSWAQALRHYREDSGITQAAVSKATGISWGYLSRIERGITPASEKQLERIRQAICQLRDEA